MLISAGHFLKVILLAIVLNSDGTYHTHEYIETHGTVIECEEDKPDTKRYRDGTAVVYHCMIIAGA